MCGQVGIALLHASFDVMLESAELLFELVFAVTFGAKPGVELLDAFRVAVDRPFVGEERTVRPAEFGCTPRGDQLGADGWVQEVRIRRRLDGRRWRIRDKQRYFVHTGSLNEQSTGLVCSFLRSSHQRA